MSQQTLRQRDVLHTSAQAAALHVVRSQLAKVPPPKKHFEDTVVGMTLTFAAAILVLGVVGIRFFHIAVGGTP